MLSGRPVLLVLHISSGGACSVLPPFIFSRCDGPLERPLRYLALFSSRVCVCSEPRRSSEAKSMALCAPEGDLA